VPDYDKLRSLVRRRRVDLIVALVFTLVVAATGAYMVRYLLYTDPLKARIVGMPIPVQTVAAAVTDLRDVVGASGSVEQSATVTLKPRIVSRVDKVPVDLGSIVKEGDPLVELDDRLFAADLEGAKIKADHTGKQLHRMEVLEAKGLGTAVDTEKSRTEDAEARMAVIQAEIALSNTRISSPVDGVVLDRMTNPGETTSPDQKILLLGTLHPVMMVADVSEDKMGFVRLGMKAEVGTNAFPGVTFTGEVAKVQAEVSAKTRTFQVYIRIENPDLALKPGVTGYARLDNHHMALAVPSTAIMNPIGDRATVFVADKDNRAHLREIRRGMSAEGKTEIIDGLKEGELVVTVGQLELRDNERIRPNRSAPWNEK